MKQKILSTFPAIMKSLRLTCNYLMMMNYCYYWNLNHPNSTRTFSAYIRLRRNCCCNSTSFSVSSFSGSSPVAPVLIPVLSLDVFGFCPSYALFRFPIGKKYRKLNVIGVKNAPDNNNRPCRTYKDDEFVVGLENETFPRCAFCLYRVR